MVYEKIAILCLLTLLYPLQEAFCQDPIDGRKLLNDLKEVNGQIMDTRISLGEALIKHLANQGSYVQSERMKSIYRLATEYQNLCDCEQRVLLMYTHTKEAVKVYLSAYSRDVTQKKKKDLDESLKNLQKYLADIKDKDTIEIVTQLQSRIKQAQLIIIELIKFYASENAKYKQGKYDAFE